VAPLVFFGIATAFTVSAASTFVVVALFTVSTTFTVFTVSATFTVFTVSGPLAAPFVVLGVDLRRLEHLFVTGEFFLV
jgi:hypothetical protein